MSQPWAGSTSSNVTRYLLILDLVCSYGDSRWDSLKTEGTGVILDSISLDCLVWGPISTLHRTMPGLPYGKTTHSNSLNRTPGEHSELEAKFCIYIEELLISILFGNGMINSDACLNHSNKDMISKNVNFTKKASMKQLLIPLVG